LEHQSILSAEFIETVLGIAKRNLEQDGRLCGVLFLELAKGQRLVHTLEQLPAKPDERAFQLFRLGKALRREGKELEAAVLIVEAWYLDAKKAPGIMKISPHAHPLRQEAIMIAGRDLRKARITFVVAPFTRALGNKPAWQRVDLAVYNVKAEAGTGFEGLIDDFFSGYLSPNADA
jgi:hypothetical protein